MNCEKGMVMQKECMDCGKGMIMQKECMDCGRRSIIQKEQLWQLKKERPPVTERVDVSEMLFDPDMMMDARPEEFLRRVKNPYAFRCGDIMVNADFVTDGKTLNEAAASCLAACRRRPDTVSGKEKRK